MSDVSINRALAAAQIAKEQQNKEQERSQPINQPATTMINETLSAKIAEKAQAVQAINSHTGSNDTDTPTSAPAKPQSVYLNKSANVAGATGKKEQVPAIIAGLGDTQTQKEQGDNKFTKVELSIAGTTHRINCPASDVMNINRAAEEISEALRELRRAVRGKSPSNEELLVLHCLELYDQLREATHQKDLALADNQRAESLIDKLLKNASNIVA